MQQSSPLKLDAFPRVGLCHQPTAIEAMPRLSAHLGGADLYIKRDDCTGLATGGNKTRKLEFLVGDALSQNAELLVTQGAVQSNHVRQTAAAAAKFGLKCHALLERRVPDTAQSYETTGNVLLDQMFGTTIEYRPAGLDMNAETLAVTEQLRKDGKSPYFIPGGGSNEIGALGYAVCAEEIHAQRPTFGGDFDWIVLATGSTGTQAGLISGLHALGNTTPVLGVSVRQPEDVQINAVHKLCKSIATKLGIPALPVEKVLVDDRYVGEGYGIPAASTIEALQLAATMEGLLLDPVYSAKGFAGLIGGVREGKFKAGEKVLFIDDCRGIHRDCAWHRQFGCNGRREGQHRRSIVDRRSSHCAPAG